jgi:hypothetical protein
VKPQGWLFVAFLTVVMVSPTVLFTLARPAKAAPPTGGFALEYVGRTESRAIYRFRDGPRVCYLVEHGGVQSTPSISCVVSP